MRTAITLGITKDGTAEIIHQPSVSIHNQRREINQLAGKKGNSGYTEIQLWESGRGLRRRVRVGDGAENQNVNFNAAHRVEHQQDKKASKKLPDLTPETGTTGGVDFNAVHLVEHQQDKSKAKTLPDLNKKFQHAAAGKKASKKQGVNFDAAKRIGDHQPETPGIDRVRGKRRRGSQARIARRVSKKERISDAASSKTSTETDTSTVTSEDAAGAAQSDTGPTL
jgi:hypothetical protein